MEFHIDIDDAVSDLDAVEQVIGAVDPAVQVDIDSTGRMLRVAASITSVELASLLAEAGYPVIAQQVTQLPSICCGGCGG